MPGGRTKSRKKIKAQDKDVSFRFHSGGSLETGAYVSEGSRESPVFSDSLDDLEEPKHVSKLHTDNEDSSRTPRSVDEGNTKVDRQLLESAIDDTNTDSTHLDHPLSDALFHFDQEPLPRQELDKSVTLDEDVPPIRINTTKELEYKEANLVDEQRFIADVEDFSDSGDIMNIKEIENSEINLKPSEVHRQQDSDNEELFFSLTKEDTSMEKVNENDYAAMKNSELESDNDSLPAAVSPFSDVEDTTILTEVDTHPLISTSSVEDDDTKTKTKDGLANSEQDHQLLLTEEHFSNVPTVCEPKKNYQSSKVKPKRPPPPRPPPPRPPPPVVKPSNTPTSNLTATRETGLDSYDGITIKPEASQGTKSETSSAVHEADKAVQHDESVEGSGQRSSEIVRDDSLSLPYFVIYTLFVFLYYSLNPSSYLAGFFTGFLFFCITSALGFIWYVNYLSLIQQREKEAVQKAMELSSQQFIDQPNKDLSSMKHNKFGVRFDYDPATHHYSDNTPAHVKLEGFTLTLSIKKSSESEEHAQSSQTHDTVSYVSSEIVEELDLRDCSVVLVPDEVAQNRKRRWSKKFPISVCCKQQHHHKNHSYFLFPPTAKLKEMWFRQMKSCSEGISVKESLAKLDDFFSYMGHYMLKSISDAEKPKSEKKKKRKGDDSTVHYSMKSNEESAEEMENSAVSIDKQPKAHSMKRGASSVPILPAMTNMDWLNTALARVCWDVWHEQRWHDWVEMKIQRRISRIKTPSWMEPLSVTDVQLGRDVPTVKRVYAPPRLNTEGVWIFLAVQYKGSFTMTLETKLKLGKGQKDETDLEKLQPHLITGRVVADSKKPSDRYRKTRSSNKLVLNQDGSVDPDDIDGNHTSCSLENSTEEQPTLVHKQSMPRPSSSSSISSRSIKIPNDTGSINSSVGIDDVDSGSDEDMSVSSSLSSSPNIKQLESNDTGSSTSSVSEQTPYPSRPGKWKNMFDRFKNSSIIQKAANTRIVRMAAEKMSSYNLYLTVEVKALDGLLAVNMSPPPSDILWYGFQGKPMLDLSAKPKLGQREVTIHYVTEWIENKLKELLEKQMVLPNMESIAIPILNSGIPGDVPYKLSKLASTPK